MRLVRWLVGSVFLAGLAVGIAGGAARTDTDETDRKEILGKRLQAIRGDAIDVSGAERASALETQFLALVVDHNSPEEKGMIYAAIALECGGQGSRDPNDRDMLLGKTIEYANRALDCPLETVTRCTVYHRLGGAMLLKGRFSAKDQWEQARRDSASILLAGLKLALENGAPAEWPAPPEQVVFPYNYIAPEKTPAQMEAERRYEEYMEADRAYRRLYDLFNERSALTQNLVNAYGREPYDPGEFRTLAEKELAGYDEVVDDIVSQIEAMIAMQTGPVD